MNAVRRQSGFTLGKMLIISIVVGLVAMLAVKLTPEYLEYYRVLQNVKAVADEASTKPGITTGEIRAAFTKRASIDQITGFNANELDVSKEGNFIVIEFAYQRTVPLFANISLLIDFEGSSAR